MEQKIIDKELRRRQKEERKELKKVEGANKILKQVDDFLATGKRDFQNKFTRYFLLDQVPENIVPSITAKFKGAGMKVEVNDDPFGGKFIKAHPNKLWKPGMSAHDVKIANEELDKIVSQKMHSNRSKEIKGDKSIKGKTVELLMGMEGYKKDVTNTNVSKVEAALAASQYRQLGIATKIKIKDDKATVYVKYVPHNKQTREELSAQFNRSLMGHSQLPSPKKRESEAPYHSASKGMYQKGRMLTTRPLRGARLIHRKRR